MKKNVIITGASGMIGNIILEHCLQDKHVNSVTSLVRKTSGLQHPKLREVIVNDFSRYDPDAAFLENQDVAFFCIGVYTGAVSRDQFRKITVDYPVRFAKALHRKSPGATFCLLSGSGADRSEKSRLMFAKDKGAAENQLAAISFKSFHSFRPAYIYPVKPRREPNFSYRLMRLLYPLIRLFGKKYSIKSTELAQAMFYVGIHGSSSSILENAAIIEHLKGDFRK